MSSLNQCNLIGYLGGDPEMRYLSSGVAVTNVSLAIGRKWKDAATGQPREATEWVPLVAFEKQAEVLNTYGRKGASVYVTGRLQTRSWTGEDGAKHYKTEVVIGSLQLLDRRQAGQVAAGGPEGSGSYTIPADGDLPF